MIAGLPWTLGWAPSGQEPGPGLTWLFLFFLKIGAVLYGSGYVLLSFLRGGLVERGHWLTEGQLLDAVAVGQVTPGPVFTTAAFVGYLLDGVSGGLVATVGIFLPAFRPHIDRRPGDRGLWSDRSRALAAPSKFRVAIAVGALAGVLFFGSPAMIVGIVALPQIALAIALAGIDRT